MNGAFAVKAEVPGSGDFLLQSILVRDVEIGRVNGRDALASRRNDDA